jgi:hypothetical protein
MFASRIWNCLGKNYKNGTGQIWKTGRHLTHPFWTLNPSALNFPLPGSSSRRALLPPALSPPLPPPSSTAAGFSFSPPSRPRPPLHRLAPASPPWQSSLRGACLLGVPFPFSLSLSSLLVVLLPFLAATTGRAAAQFGLRRALCRGRAHIRYALPFSSLPAVRSGGPQT